MKIQQHDGMVVDAAGIPAGLRQASAGGRGVARGKGGAKCKGEGRRQVQGCGCPPSPPLYIGTPGGAGPRRWDLLGGVAAKGGDLPLKASGGAPSPRVPNPRCRGGPRGGRPAH